MRSPAAKNLLAHLRPSDIRGAAQLATRATVGITQIVEGVHQSVWSTLGVTGAAMGQTRGLTGLVYKGVRGTAHVLGAGVDALLAKVLPWIERDEDASSSPQREAILAALNGVLGDRLAASDNTLATPMTLRFLGQTLQCASSSSLACAVPDATGKLLLLVHGLCMNDLQWNARSEKNAVDHGAILASQLGYTPLYLRYNTGLHTSQNGRELSAVLEQLISHWPKPIQEIAVLAHSMGGLVTRSAVHCAQQDGLRWHTHLKSIVFLGTPHHGALLEKAGNWVDIILGSTPYSAPFAKLGQLRSAGITDLRYGHVADTDWQGQDRFRRTTDRRQPMPLPTGVACFAVAATTSAQRSALADRLIGDGLVPLRSALGQHDDEQHRLVFAKGSKRIFYRMNHMQLLSSTDVSDQLAQWLA